MITRWVRLAFAGGAIMTVAVVAGAPAAEPPVQADKPFACASIGPAQLGVCLRSPLAPTSE